MIHKLYKTKEEIASWLNDYKIEYYDLIEDKKYGYVVNVIKNVNLNNYDLKEIKVKFNIINGNFDCSNNQLETLYGSPKEVKGSFNCENNNLKLLKWCPIKIDKNFYCSYNQLLTLEGCPKTINGSFYCFESLLITLEFFPNQVNGKVFLLNNNKLGEVKNITSFEELKKIHKSIVLKKKLNNKLEKEMNIDNSKKNVKIKL